jgi:hypothetical protein
LSNRSGTGGNTTIALRILCTVVSRYMMVNFLFTDNVHLAPISKSLLVKFINKLLKELSSEMIRPKLGSVDTSSLKSEMQRFLEKSTRPLKLQRYGTSYGCWLFGNKLPTAHTDLSAAFYLLHKAVGNGAMNKFGNCSQWRTELLITRMLLFSGTMNAPRYCQQRNELLY